MVKTRDQSFKGQESVDKEVDTDSQFNADTVVSKQSANEEKVADNNNSTTRRSTRLKSTHVSYTEVKIADMSEDERRSSPILRRSRRPENESVNHVSNRGNSSAESEWENDWDSDEVNAAPDQEADSNNKPIKDCSNEAVSNGQGRWKRSRLEEHESYSVKMPLRNRNKQLTYNAGGEKRSYEQYLRSMQNSGPFCESEDENDAVSDQRSSRRRSHRDSLSESPSRSVKRRRTCTSTDVSMQPPDSLGHETKDAGEVQVQVQRKEKKLVESATGWQTQSDAENESNCNSASESAQAQDRSQQSGRMYNLRQRRPPPRCEEETHTLPMPVRTKETSGRTNDRYESRVRRPPKRLLYDVSTTSSTRRHRDRYRDTDRFLRNQQSNSSRRSRRHRRMMRFNSSSSGSDSDSDSSSSEGHSNVNRALHGRDDLDEFKMQRAIERSIQRSRARCAPLNELLNATNCASLLDSHGELNLRVLFDDSKGGSKVSSESSIRVAIPSAFKQAGASGNKEDGGSKRSRLLADVEPMKIDSSVRFEQIGGLSQHITALKEMIVLPLVYPDLFKKLGIAVPRGVLFHGPPGTGKTLIARAVANECCFASQNSSFAGENGRRISFFMRKGADCLSKWIGESERQLRLLFDEAYRARPSIIFFDEIDGLAPVRSSRQDQIHSSIVSTLLALMDGLDERGEVVVIGATNWLDNIDPALRRPGRFDREFYFPLPNRESRREILSILMKKAALRLDSATSEVEIGAVLDSIADVTAGYCGADLKALSAEAGLIALRRTVPEIYDFSQRFHVDADRISVTVADFRAALKRVIPASKRSAKQSIGHSLANHIRPLLGRQLAHLLRRVLKVFPSAARCVPSIIKSLEINEPSAASQVEAVDDLEDMLDELTADSKSASSSLMESSRRAYGSVWTHLPRLVILPDVDADADGDDSRRPTHSAYLLPALLHALSDFPLHTIDIAALMSSEVQSPEEAVCTVFKKATVTCPSVIYLPQFDTLLENVPATVQESLRSLLNELDASLPVLVLASSQQVEPILRFFSMSDVVRVSEPETEEVRRFFSPLLLEESRVKIADHSTLRRACEAKRQNARAAAPVDTQSDSTVPSTAAAYSSSVSVKRMSRAELDALLTWEEAVLRELRIFLRELLGRLMRDKRFTVFAKAVDPVEVPDYYDIIKSPIDFGTMMRKIDTAAYGTVRQFLDDVDLLCSNTLEYNPETNAEDRLLRHKACGMRDLAYAVVNEDLDPDFERLVQAISRSRSSRQHVGVSQTVPAFYLTRQLQAAAAAASATNTTSVADAEDTSVAARTDNGESGGGNQEQTNGADASDSSNQVKAAEVQEEMETETNQEGEMQRGADTEIAAKEEENSCGSEKIIEIVEIDEEKVAFILNELVLKVCGLKYSVSQLDAVYSSVAHRIHQHRFEASKTDLLNDLQKLVDDLR